MSKDKTARLNRLLTNGRCLDIALDHGAVSYTHLTLPTNREV